MDALQYSSSDNSFYLNEVKSTNLAVFASVLKEVAGFHTGFLARGGGKNGALARRKN